MSTVGSASTVTSLFPGQVAGNLGTRLGFSTYSQYASQVDQEFAGVFEDGMTSLYKRYNGNDGGLINTLKPAEGDPQIVQTSTRDMIVNNQSVNLGMMMHVTSILFDPNIYGLAAYAVMDYESDRFHFTKIIFPPAMPVERPELTTVPKIGYHTEAMEGFIRTYGLGFECSTDVLKTELGQRIVATGIASVMQRIAEMRTLFMLDTIFHMGEVQRQKAREMADELPAVPLSEAANRFSRLFDGQRKDPDNFLTKIHSQARMVSRNRGLPEPDRILLSDRQIKFAAEETRNVEFWIGGPRGQQVMLTQANDLPAVGAVQPFIVVSMGGSNDAIGFFERLNTRVAQVGSYYMARPTFHTAIAPYSSDQKVIGIYDIRANRRRPITLEDQLKNCHIFHAHGYIPHLSDYPEPFQNDLPKDMRQLPLYYAKFTDHLHFTDHSMHHIAMAGHHVPKYGAGREMRHSTGGVLAPVHFVGQLKPNESITTDIVKMTCNTILAKIDERIRSESKHAFTEYRSVLNSIKRSTFGSAESAFLVAVCRAESNQFAIPDGQNIVGLYSESVMIADPSGGAPMIPDNAAVPPVPVGYDSASGFRYLASLNPDAPQFAPWRAIILQLQVAVPKFENFVSLMEAFFCHNPFYSTMLASSQWTHATISDVLFENFISQTVPAFYVDTPAGNVVAGSTARAGLAIRNLRNILKEKLTFGRANAGDVPAREAAQLAPLLDSDPAAFGVLAIIDLIHEYVYTYGAAYISQGPTAMTQANSMEGKALEDALRMAVHDEAAMRMAFNQLYDSINKALPAAAQNILTKKGVMDKFYAILIKNIPTILDDYMRGSATEGNEAPFVDVPNEVRRTTFTLSYDLAVKVVNYRSPSAGAYITPARPDNHHVPLLRNAYDVIPKHANPSQFFLYGDEVASFTPGQAGNAANVLFVSRHNFGAHSTYIPIKKTKAERMMMPGYRPEADMDCDMHENYMNPTDRIRFVHDVCGEIKHSESMQRNLEMVFNKHSSDALMQFLMLSVLTSELCFEQLQDWIGSDVALPVAFMLTTPFETYYTDMTVVMKSGQETLLIVERAVSFQAGFVPTIKQMGVTAEYGIGSLENEPRNVQPFHHTMITNHLGGKTADMLNLQDAEGALTGGDLNDAIMARHEDHTGSVMVFLVPATFKPEGKPLLLCPPVAGKMEDFEVCKYVVPEDCYDSTFPTAWIYAGLYNLKERFKSLHKHDGHPINAKRILQESTTFFPGATDGLLSVVQRGQGPTGHMDGITDKDLLGYGQRYSNCLFAFSSKLLTV